MWKRGGQSSALDRAQALLSAKRNSRGVAQSTHGSPAKTQGTMDGSIKTRPAPPNAHTLFSDLSDLSSLSSAPEHGADTIGSAAPDKNQGRNGDSKDLRPQSSLGGGGSRFLKKAPPHVKSSQSLVSKSHMQQMPEPRYVSPSQRGSQAAALSRLAQIESRFCSRKQPQEQARQGPKPAHNLTSNLGMSPPPDAVTQSLEASILPISAQSSSDQSLKGKHFLKKKAAAAVDNTNTAASGSSKGPDGGVLSWSRTAAVVPLGGLETKSMKVAHGVSLESDEEDMRKLLGDSLDSTDNSFLRPEKISSMKKPDKVLNQKAHSTPTPAAVQPLPSNTAPSHSPASPSHRSSPFRFTGQAQAHFSPSALSPSPSPPCISPSLSRRLSFPRRVGSPQRSDSAMSGHSEVLSLEELFPVQPASEDLHSEISVVSSEDFKLNVMTLDDLVPATLGFTEETSGKKREEHNPPVFGSPERHEELPRYKEGEQQQQQEEEDMLDYQSDFESESRTERNYSASQVSEQLLGDGDEEEAVSEVRDEALDSDVSHGRTEDDYSSTFSDPSRSYMSRTSDHSDASESLSRSRDSRSPVSHSSRTSSQRSSRRAAARRVLKEAAVQTQAETMASTWSTGMTTSGHALGLPYMNPTSVAAHTLSAETVQALSTYNPALFVLNEMLKQQLATTSRFIESSRHLHSSLLQSLEPPNYRYTMLEDTKEYIRMHRPPKLTMEEALKEVMQEMREYHSTVCD